MKYLALTVKQPFATLMVTSDLHRTNQAYKPLEARKWATVYRGPVLIHTGKQIDRDVLEDTNACESPFPKHYPTGSIVGMATLVDCRRPTVGMQAALLEECDALYGRIYDFSTTEEHIPPWMFGEQIWLWEFRDPILFQPPIPCKGKLRLWSQDESYYTEIEKQMQFK